MELTILEKIEKATDNMSKVYQRGYDNGLKAGGSSGADEESINAALDDVIAFQDSLIPKILEFTISDSTTGDIHTLQFEEGMTWEDWVKNIIYNTDGYSISDWGGIYLGTHPVYYNYDVGQIANSSDVIEANHQYVMPW